MYTPAASVVAVPFGLDGWPTMTVTPGSGLPVAMSLTVPPIVAGACRTKSIAPVVTPAVTVILSPSVGWHSGAQPQFL